MNKLFSVSFNWLAPQTLALAAAIALFAPCAANATPYVVKLTQQGSNVVASGSGEFDLTGLSFFVSSSTGGGMTPSNRSLITGRSAPLDAYTALTGPASFGNGGVTFASSGTGDLAGIFQMSDLQLIVPQGYVSNTTLTSGATWDNATFASLGVTPGTYVWTWGTAADRSFTLIIPAAVAVPEPAALGMFGLGLLLIGGFANLRRRGQP